MSFKTNTKMMNIKKLISQSVKLSFLTISLPLLISLPSFSRECIEAETQANLAKLPNLVDRLEDQYQKYAFLIMVTQCNPGAVESLISILQNKAITAEVRHHAALTLAYKADFGLMGTLFSTPISQEDQSKIINALIRVLTDQQDDPEVHYGVVKALSYYLGKDHKLGDDSPEMIKALITLVKDPQNSTKVRIQALSPLSQIYEEKNSLEITTTLAAILADTQDNLEVRSQVADVLGVIDESSPEVIKAFIAVVDNPQDNPELRLHAIDILRKISHSSPQVAKTFIAIAKNSQDQLEIRLHAINTLSQITAISLFYGSEDLQTNPELRTINTLEKTTEISPEVVQALITIVKNPQDDSEIRLLAINTVIAICNNLPKVVKTLTTIVENPQNNPELRFRATSILEGIHDASPEVFKTLIAVVENFQDNPKIRLRAIDILEQTTETKTSSEAIQALIAVVENSQDNSEMRLRVIDILEEISDSSPEVVKALITIAENPQDNSEMRLRVINILGQMRENSPEIVQALTALANNQQENPKVREEAASWLNPTQVSSDMLVTRPEIIHQILPPDATNNASQEDIQTLMATLADQQKSQEVREKAASDLFFRYWRNLPAAIQPLVTQALVNIVINKQESVDFRSHIAQTLFDFPDTSPEIIKRLTAIVEDVQDSPEVRRYAARNLGKIYNNSPEVLQTLTTTIQDPQDSTEVRLEIIDIFGKFRQATPVILQALITIIENQQDNLEVRSHANHTLYLIKNTHISSKNKLRKWINSLKSVLAQQDTEQEIVIKDIKSEIERSENHLRSYEGKERIDSIILVQRADYPFRSGFAATIQELGYKLPEETQKYHYAVVLQSGDTDSVMITAQAKLEGLYSFTGAVFIDKPNNSQQSPSIICRTILPSTTPPEMPSPPTPNRPASCPLDSVQVD